MALSLKQLTSNEYGFADRPNTLAMLERIAELQIPLLMSAAQDTPRFNSAAHYPQPVAKIEHVCRLLWGLAPAGDIAVQQQIREMIVQGCDPESEHYWQMPTHYDQRVVEMASIATAIIDAQAYYWDPLTDNEKHALARWLLTVKDLELPPNNWRWFRILILTALELVGAKTDQQVLQRDLAFVDELYLADGWYQDGRGGVIDYYNPFAFQLYGLMYARWRKGEGELCQRLVNRAVEFSRSYQYWFAEDGKPLCYGRSLNYRFAGAAFWVELARCGHRDADIALARTCWQQTMQWWAKQPIWDSNAQLLPGYAYPNLLTSEFYTSYASPMLALKAFNALALSEDHPFWQAKLKPLSDSMTPMAIGQHHQLVRRGGSYLITNGASANELRNCEDKYGKFAYSSDHGLCVESCRWIDQGWAGDNIFAFRHPETQQWFSRTKNTDSYTFDGALVSIWQPFNGCEVKTTQRFTKDTEVRLHQIKADQALDFVMTGYAVNCWNAWFSHQQPRAARVESDELFSELIMLEGKADTCVFPCAPNTNLIHPHASVPAVTGRVVAGETVLLVEVHAGKLPAN
ncbi:DUF2264 domain-containing protein [Vibrio sp. TRT 21S02]|uniref:DUF2264 domain-containing protein n=1 Tax=Vibrio sp. TRT 21S02 TaxID=3418507 RepID=UPI003CF64FB5